MLPPKASPSPVVGLNAVTIFHMQTSPKVSKLYTIEKSDILKNQEAAVKNEKIIALNLTVLLIVDTQTETSICSF